MSSKSSSLPHCSAVKHGAPVVARNRGRPKHQWWLIGVTALIVVTTVVALAVEYGWWGKLIAMMDRVNPVLTIVLMALLPLAGFSVSVVYVVAGLKFGLWGGALVIVGVTSLHLLGTHWIGRSFLRGPIQRFLERRDYRLPEAPVGAERSLAAMVALVPGPPYFLRNYALAISGIPLRRYFWVCLGVYTVRSFVTLALGDLGGNPDGAGVFWLGVILMVKLGICALLIRRIGRKHKEMRRRGGGASHPSS
ncbi:MAG: VTT domain-containing protein [Nibricoccus sp.]